MNNIRTGWIISCGILLLGMYGIFAWSQNNFSIPDFSYQRNYELFMKGTPLPILYSQIAKTIFLLPATVLFSLAFMRSGIRLPQWYAIRYRTLVVFVLFVSTILLILSVQFLFQETEVTDDENTYDFQAQTLLAGRMVNPPPPAQSSFENAFIINDGRIWSGRYTLGHPAIIAFGMILGNRYIGIIAISILTLVLVYAIGKELFGEKRIAFLALCLGAVSPFFYLVSSSRLSHTTSTFFLALFMYLFLHARNTEKRNWALVLSLFAGFSLGYAFNTRPWTAFAWSLPFLLVMSKDAIKFSTNAVSRGLMLIAGFAVIFICTLYSNSVVTGNPMLFPYSYYNSGETIGFSFSGHTPIVGLQNLWLCLTRLNMALFGFPVSLIFVLAMLFSKKEFGDHLLFGIITSIAVFYLGFYSPGVSDLGPVYYYEMLIPLLLLSARGVFFLHEKFSESRTQWRKFIPAFLVLSCIGSFGTFIPERISHIARLTERVREPYETVRISGIHQALVMIQPFAPQGWVFGYRNPSPQFTDDVIYCQYADSVSNHHLLRFFDTRSFFILQYDTTSMHFVVVPINNTIRKQTVFLP